MDVILKLERYNDNEFALSGVCLFSLPVERLNALAENKRKIEEPPKKGAKKDDHKH